MVSKIQLQRLLRCAMGVFFMSSTMVIEAAPIAIQSISQLAMPTNYQTVEVEGRTYVPLKAIEEASFYIFKETGDKVEVFVPRVVNQDNIKTEGIELTIPNYVQGVFIGLPIKKIEGKNYIDQVLVGPAVGVGATNKTAKSLPGFGGVEGQILVLSNLQGQLTVPAKKQLGQLVWAFDPVGTRENAYGEKQLTVGDHVISPSWFQLERQGKVGVSQANYMYVEEYRKSGFYVWPLITNQFKPALTHEVVSNQELWGDYKDYLVAYALLYGYNGYNFDFENIDIIDRERLTNFVTYLGKELKDVGLYTSIDVTGYSTSENWSLVYDRPKLAEAVDYVVHMAYDETWSASKWAGPVASFPWVKSHTERMLKEVPAEKLVLGVPFYMRDWREKPIHQGDMKKPFDEVMGKTLAMKDVAPLVEKYKAEMTWDDELKLHYFTYLDESGYRHAVWAEDEDSLKEKMGLVKDLKLAGFAAWRKGFESPAHWKVIDKVLNEIAVQEKAQQEAERIEREKSKNQKSLKKKNSSLKDEKKTEKSLKK